MKKIVVLIAILSLCLVLFVVPSFASPSPSVPSYPFPAVQPYQTYLFLSEYDTTPFPSVSYSDYASYVYTNWNDETSVSFLVFTLDISYNYVNPGNWKLLSFSGSTNVTSTTAYGRSIDISGSALTDGSTFFSLRFYSPNTEVAYFALIPLDNDESEVSTNMQNLVDGWYSGYNQGMSFINDRVYDHAFRLGQSEGFSEGYQLGVQSVDSDTLGSSLRSFVLTSISAPFQAISNFLNFEIFGINVLAIFSFVVTAVILVFVIKHFVG